MFTLLDQHVTYNTNFDMARGSMLYGSIQGQSPYLYKGINPLEIPLTSDAVTEQHMKGYLYRSDGGSVSSSDDNFSSDGMTRRRARRVFVPDAQKDEYYWIKRLKNNDSARRSRSKRKAMENKMEEKYLAVEKENMLLRRELQRLKKQVKRIGNYENDVAGIKIKIDDLDYERCESPGNSADDTPPSVVHEHVVDLVNDGTLSEKSDETSSASVDDSDYKNNNSDDSRQYCDVYISDTSNQSDESLTSKPNHDVINRIPHKFRLKFQKHSAFFMHEKTIS